MYAAASVPNASAASRALTVAASSALCTPSILCWLSLSSRAFTLSAILSTASSILSAASWKWLHILSISICAPAISPPTAPIWANALTNLEMSPTAPPAALPADAMAADRFLAAPAVRSAAFVASPAPATNCETPPPW